ncbi:MAG: c-type cytochrome [Chitinophagaceae bacterium]|nr:c-type cytochrome [Chitinophagaceae bacterium]
MKKWVVLIVMTVAGFAFTTVIQRFSEERPVYIPSSPQRTGGDPKKGYEYLIKGDYVKGGIPYNMYTLGIGKSRANFLQREGINEKVSHEYTAIHASNGEILVAPNCLQCHAQVMDDKLIVGLGNTFIDFTRNQRLNIANLERAEAFLRATAPRKYEAAANFFKVTKAIGPYLSTEVRGMNSADRLAGVLAAHRDPVTFKWLNKPQMDIPLDVIPTDVPAWWLLKKKNAMFYNGFGRGDFGKFLMASNLLTVNDTAESRQVDGHMPDMLAYIYSLTAPKYPKIISPELAQEGKALFEQNCAHCHGTYGPEPDYPNLLIPISSIQTDSFLCKSNYSNPQFVNWFNNSWFTKGDHPARLEPFNGYIAPPLDGIWITAPYLHNGSIPTLDALLNSALRPAHWSRNFENPELDYEKIGWKYKKHPRAEIGIFNTNIPGYGNYGHYFSDSLTNEEREALLEYLKTL